MTEQIRRWMLAVLIVVSTACRPDPGKEEWKPPPAGASAAEVEAQVSESSPDVPSRPRRAGTGASRAARTADKKTYGSIKEGTEALFKAVKNGNINLFG